MPLWEGRFSKGIEPYITFRIKKEYDREFLDEIKEFLAECKVSNELKGKE